MRKVQVNSNFQENEAELDVFAIPEEKDHESWRHHHRGQQQSRLSKQVVHQEAMAARISIPVFEEDVSHASMDATAFFF